MIINQKRKVLYVFQEIIPYVDENPISVLNRKYPSMAVEGNNEVRIFMPKFGCINERRHQLHEVIRLSGLKIVINDVDYPLIIKVASLPSARMQVYFIENDVLFSRKALFKDKETGKFFNDNDERAIFFARGVAETIKKLGWKPDIIHCVGWFSMLVPMYLKKYYEDDSMFNDAKYIFTLFENEGGPKSLSKKIYDKFEFDGFNKKDYKHLAEEPSLLNLTKTAIDYSDAIVYGSEKLPPDVEKYIKKSGLPVLPYKQEIELSQALNDFMNQLVEEESVVD